MSWPDVKLTPQRNCAVFNLMSMCLSVEDVHFNFSLLDEVNFMVDAHSALSRPVDFTNIPENIFAEQLTYMDSVRDFSTFLGSS